MPPQLFIAGDEAADFDAGTGVVSFAVPEPGSLRVGDQLFAIFAVASAVADVDTIDGEDPTDAGWDAFVSLVIGTRSLLVWRHEVADDDPSTYEFTLDAPVAGYAAIVAYRASAPSTDVVASSGTNIAAATAFVCPSLVATRYSDLYVGVTWAENQASTPPVGATERLDAAGATGRLAVFDFLPEAVGATGTQTSTAAGAANGFAAAFLVAAEGLRAANKVIDIDPPGALGLPTEGV